MIDGKINLKSCAVRRFFVGRHINDIYEFAVKNRCICDFRYDNRSFRSGGRKVLTVRIKDNIVKLVK